MNDEDYQETSYNFAERQLAEKAIYNFQTERLLSYFSEHTDIRKPAFDMLAEAGALQKNGHSQAAFLFYVSAVEITIKEAMVKPIVHGLVHEVAAAELIVALIPKELGSDNFGKLLFGVLNRICDLDLATYKRDGSNQTVWEEAKQVQKARNQLIHGGIPVPADKLDLAKSLANEFLYSFFKEVVGSIVVRTI